FLTVLPPPLSTLFPYTTLFRSCSSSSRTGSTQSSAPPDSTTTASHRFVDGSPAAPRWASSSHRTSPSAQCCPCGSRRPPRVSSRSEEHTSELQSRENLVCRLLL